MPQRREQRERRRHRGSHQYYDEKRGKHTLGKVLAVIQLLISVIFVGILFNSGMIPMKYLAAGAAVLFVLFALTFGLQFARSKVNLIGVILSILISAALAFGTYYFMNMHKAISNLGGAEYKRTALSQFWIRRIIFLESRRRQTGQIMKKCLRN